MELRKLGRWDIEIDKTKTKEFYTSYHKISEDCECQGCRNYVNACNHYDDIVKQFFEDLGIEPIKEAEVYVCTRNDNGTLLYGGFYHVVGKLINGADYWCKNGRCTSYAEPHRLNDDFSYGCTKNLALVPDTFPEPVLQLEFMANLPWVLEEDCEY